MGPTRGESEVWQSLLSAQGHACGKYFQELSHWEPNFYKQFTALNVGCPLQPGDMEESHHARNC